jgi:hypothetical protein
MSIDYPHDSPGAERTFRRLAREQAITVLKREQFAKLVQHTLVALREAMPDDPEEALEFLHKVQNDI